MNDDLWCRTCYPDRVHAAHKEGKTMSKHYIVTLKVESPYTEWYRGQYPDADYDAFDEIRDSGVSLVLGENGSTPIFEIIEYISMEVTDDE